MVVGASKGKMRALKSGPSWNPGIFGGSKMGHTSHRSRDRISSGILAFLVFCLFSVPAVNGDTAQDHQANDNQTVSGKIAEAALGQFLALIAFFAFPAIQYWILKRSSRSEGQPGLWYMPAYQSFRLVIRNLPGHHALSDIRQRALLRTDVSSRPGASVKTLLDDVLSEREDFFVFPGTDQILINFRIEGDSPGDLFFVVTDKLGAEKKRVSLNDFDRLICDYVATLNNVLNFNVRLQKRAELGKTSMVQFWTQIRTGTHEREFSLDRVRDVG
jgi:hypothetical protein